MKSASAVSCLSCSYCDAIRVKGTRYPCSVFGSWPSRFWDCRRCHLFHGMTRNRPRACASRSRCPLHRKRESWHDGIGCAVRRIRPRPPEPRDTQTQERRECHEKECELKSVPASKSSRLCVRSSCQETRCSSPIRRERSRQSLLHGGEQPAGDARPRPAVDDRLPGGLPQHVVLGWRKCEHLIQLAGEIGRIAGLEGC